MQPVRDQPAQIPTPSATGIKAEIYLMPNGCPCSYYMPGRSLCMVARALLERPTAKSPISSFPASQAFLQTFTIS